jgi:hypothetical protein
MENKQTAIEWLVEKLNQCEPWYSGLNDSTYEHINGLIEHARKMEKEQIVIAGNFCQKEDCHSVIIADSVNGPTRGIISIGEHYYNETYGE